MKTLHSATEEEMIEIETDPPTVIVGNAPELYWIGQLQVDTNSREIYIYGEIDENFGDAFLKIFRFLLNKSHDPITIWLNTPGGDLEAAFMFYDLVTSSPASVITIGTGSICSAGVLMLSCGYRRLVTENCSVMSHESSFYANEKGIRHSEAKDRRKWEDWTSERFTILLGKCTSRTKPDKDGAYWKKITERKAEYWILGGESIVAEGLADAVLTKEDLTNKGRK